jgi:hypothetical protein
MCEVKSKEKMAKENKTKKTKHIVQRGTGALVAINSFWPSHTWYNWNAFNDHDVPWWSFNL